MGRDVEPHLSGVDGDDFADRTLVPAPIPLVPVLLHLGQRRRRRYNRRRRDERRFLDRRRTRGQERRFGSRLNRRQRFTEEIEIKN